MATDFNKNTISVDGIFKQTKRNCPSDIRTRIETIADVSRIPLPFVGMIFYVIDENEFYRVLTLKSQTVAGRPQEDMLVATYEKLVKLDGLASETYVDDAIKEIELKEGAQGPKGDPFTYEDFTEEQLDALKGVDGVNGIDGKSAFDIAVDKGFEGSEEDWLASLKGEDGFIGADGKDGKSAFDIAVDKGFEGDEESWLASLKGDKGVDGIQGEMGPEGPAGKDGVNGIDGKSAFDIAVDKGFEGSEEDWLASLKGEKGVDGVQGEQGIQGEMGPQGPAGKDGIFNIDEIYDLLLTEDKSVLGAINELFNMIQVLTPSTPVGSKMYYGFIPYEVSGTIDDYTQITLDMINRAGDSMIAVPSEKIGKVSVGVVPQGGLIVVAVPRDFKFVVTKDNGFGGKVPFNTDVLGTNTTTVIFDGVPYSIYGEMLLTDGEIFVHIN